MQYENFQHIYALGLLFHFFFNLATSYCRERRRGRKEKFIQTEEKHPVTWKSGPKGFQNGFAVSKPHIVLAQESNFFF